MVRRLLCLGAILLAIVLGVAACDSTDKAKTGKTVSDPDAGAKPNPAGGAKGG